MLLLELKERIDRFTHYGYWIDPNNQLHPVEYQQHGSWVTKNILRTLTPEEREQYGSYATGYEIAFVQGYVRLQHSEPSSIGIEGSSEALKRVYPILRQTFAQEDVNKVLIDVISLVDGDIHRSDTFRLPHDRAEIQEFFTTL